MDEYINNTNTHQTIQYIFLSNLLILHHDIFDLYCIFYMLTIAWVTGTDWLIHICYSKPAQAGTVVTPS